MPRRVLALAVLVSLGAAVLVSGCDGDGAGDAPTATALPSPMLETMTPLSEVATVTPPAPTSPVGEEPTSPTDGGSAPDIRREDLTDEPSLVNFLAQAGGAVDASQIEYADLTGDGAEEAVVPVSSGGEGGDIAVFVFGYRAGTLQEMLRVLPEGRSLRADLANGKLAVTEPLYGPGEPLCCPSEFRITTYGWDGSAFAVASEEIVPAS